jgi:hypothetical protein
LSSIDRSFIERLPTPIVWAFILAAAIVFWIVVGLVVATLFHVT